MTREGDIGVAENRLQRWTDWVNPWVELFGEPGPVTRERLVADWLAGYPVSRLIDEHKAACA